MVTMQNCAYKAFGYHFASAERSVHTVLTHPPPFPSRPSSLSPDGYLPGIGGEKQVAIGEDEEEEERSESGDDSSGDPDDGNIDQALKQADATAGVHSQYVTVNQKKVRRYA